MYLHSNHSSGLAIDFVWEVEQLDYLKTKASVNWSSFYHNKGSVKVNQGTIIGNLKVFDFLGRPL